MLKHTLLVLLCFSLSLLAMNSAASQTITEQDVHSKLPEDSPTRALAKLEAQSINPYASNCSKAVDVVWKTASDLLGLIPGKEIITKLPSLLSKLTNNATCINNDESSATLLHMTEIAREEAHRVYNDKMREQISDVGEGLIKSLADFTNAISEGNYDSEAIQLELVEIKGNAETIESNAKSIGYDSLGALYVITATKFSALNLLYELTGSDEYLRQRTQRAKHSREVLESLEANYTEYLKNTKKVLIDKTSIVPTPTGTPYYVYDFTYQLKNGSRVLWSQGYYCNAKYSLCQDASSKRETLKNKQDKEYEKVRGSLGATFVSFKAQIMSIETATPTSSSWQYFMTAQSGARKCIDTSNSHENGVQLYLWDCELPNRNQRFFPAANGLIHDATRFDKCLNVRSASLVSGAPIELNNCNTNASHQKFVIENDNSIRPTHASHLCITASGRERKSKLTLEHCGAEGSLNQQWFAFKTIKSKNGECFDSLGARNNGIPVGTKPCKLFDGEQLWSSGGNGQVRLFNKPSGCIDPRGPSYAAGTRIQLWECLDNYTPHEWVENIVIDNENPLINSTKRISPLAAPNVCLTTDGASIGKVTLQTCSDDDTALWY